jgi:hypothetical protein
MYRGNSEGLTGEVLQIDGGSWYELWWSCECGLKREEDELARRAQIGSVYSYREKRRVVRCLGFKCPPAQRLNEKS